MSIDSIKEFFQEMTSPDLSWFDKVLFALDGYNSLPPQITTLVGALFGAGTVAWIASRKYRNAMAKIEDNLSQGTAIEIVKTSATFMGEETEEGEKVKLSLKRRGSLATKDIFHAHDPDNKEGVAAAKRFQDMIDAAVDQVRETGQPIIFDDFFREKVMRESVSDEKAQNFMNNVYSKIRSAVSGMTESTLHDAYLGEREEDLCVYIVPVLVVRQNCYGEVKPQILTVASNRLFLPEDPKLIDLGSADNSRLINAEHLKNRTDRDRVALIQDIHHRLKDRNDPLYNYSVSVETGAVKQVPNNSNMVLRELADENIARVEKAIADLSEAAPHP